ncbi:hypothetical protein AB0H43_02030 [Hamadaea sp. NPDC050747]|uniref:hypothetical protein n=1 Tax=Hamadaea sp. NPDC050747 TaxID=3155789 RepID=UPI0033F9F7F0
MQFDESVRTPGFERLTVVESKTFIGPTFAQVQVAPKRRAFLVREGDTARLGEAMACAATIWGGVRSILLPVREDGSVGPLWLQAAQSMQVIDYVDFTVDEDHRSAWTEEAAKAVNRVPAPPIEDGRYWNAHPIVAIGQDQLQRTSFDLPVERTLLTMAGVGDVLIHDERKLWADAGVMLRTDTTPTDLALAQLRGTTVLRATAAHDVDTVIVSPFMSTLGLVWVMDDPEDFNEAVWFWNCRAIRPNAWDESTTILTSSEVLLEPLVRDALLERVRATSRTEPDLTIVGLAKEPEELRELARGLGVSDYASRKVKERIFSKPPDPDRQLAAAIMFNMVDGWMRDRSTGPQNEAPMSWQRPTSELRAKTPLAWNPGFMGSGHVVVRISAPEIVGPQRNAVAHLYHQNATWEQGRLQLVSFPYSQYSLTIGVPSAEKVLEAACLDAGVHYVLNDKGQQIRGVLSAGVDPKIFRSRGANGVIAALTAEPDRDLRRTLIDMRDKREISDDSVKELLELSASKKISFRTLGEIATLAPCQKLKLKKPEVAKILEQLISVGLVLRGWRVDCATCALQEFEEIGAITPVARCRGCGSAARYAGGPQGEPEIYYRLNSLLQRVSLNGGVAVLAASCLLGEEGSYLLPGVNVDQSGAPLGDLDILGWRASQLFAGEAKSTAAGFAGQDHRRDVSKSKAVGADTHLMICLEELDSQVKDEVKGHCDEVGIDLRVIDGPGLLL